MVCRCCGMVCEKAWVEVPTIGESLTNVGYNDVPFPSNIGTQSSLGYTETAMTSTLCVDVSDKSAWNAAHNTEVAEPKAAKCGNFFINSW